MRTIEEVRETLREEKRNLGKYLDDCNSEDYYTQLGWVEALEYVLRRQDETRHSKS
jgi:hypothetical protein